MWIEDEACTSRTVHPKSQSLQTSRPYSFNLRELRISVTFLCHMSLTLAIRAHIPAASGRPFSATLSKVYLAGRYLVHCLSFRPWLGALSMCLLDFVVEHVVEHRKVLHEASGGFTLLPLQGGFSIHGGLSLFELVVFQHIRHIRLSVFRPLNLSNIYSCFVTSLIVLHGLFSQLGHIHT
ncbi:hypothetical protein HYPSUDRAFT_37315 [Hypholoma sublateritium FD-334 SS-4]|uniref:Uncharacterized protein n=1 Tax=Hypholoma sublateritium (strain FD-334 SS-4) TaxID=945553 RepID=A0A0D2P4I3_HYPSF|nr:hypothetical protein HYPSUDRAFT_37315 [Hypholoma sublateritium FD-334 SS-4]